MHHFQLPREEDPVATFLECELEHGDSFLLARIRSPRAIPVEQQVIVHAAGFYHIPPSGTDLGGRLATTLAAADLRRRPSRPLQVQGSRANPTPPKRLTDRRRLA
jgi:hypothetical protein